MSIEVVVLVALRDGMYPSFSSYWSESINSGLCHLNMSIVTDKSLTIF